MSFASFTTYHQVNAQSNTKSDEILLSETLCIPIAIGTLCDLVLQKKP